MSNIYLMHPTANPHRQVQSIFLSSSSELNILTAHYHSKFKQLALRDRVKDIQPLRAFDAILLWSEATIKHPCNLFASDCKCDYK